MSAARAKSISGRSGKTRIGKIAKGTSRLAEKSTDGADSLVIVAASGPELGIASVHSIHHLFSFVSKSGP
jgi:hypothetical protein